MEEEGGGGLYAFLATNNSDVQDVRDKLQDLTVPVIVIQVQCDYIPYAVAYEYVDLHSNSQYMFVESAGHEIWWEQADEYISAIEMFLNDIP